MVNTLLIIIVPTNFIMVLGVLLLLLLCGCMFPAQGGCVLQLREAQLGEAGPHLAVGSEPCAILNGDYLGVIYGVILRGPKGHINV